MIRNPIEIINSIYNYNEKNKDWGVLQVKNPETMIYIQMKSLDFIKDSLKIFPGILIDHYDLINNKESTLLKIYEVFFNNKSHNEINSEVVKKITFMTDMIKDVSENSKFWTNKNANRKENTKTKNLIQNNKTKIDELIKKYNNLKSLTI